MKFDKISTILVEIKSVINSRPLTCVHDDTEGIAYPLKLLHLVNGRNLDCLPSDARFEILHTYISLPKRARYSQQLLNQFTTTRKKEHSMSQKIAVQTLESMLTTLFLLEMNNRQYDFGNYAEFWNC